MPAGKTRRPIFLTAPICGSFVPTAAPQWGIFWGISTATPFLQIGEHKYGKPTLDRVVKPSTSLQDAQKAVLLSMDSTLRSNLSVGMPLDLAVIEKDACKVTMKRRIEAGDPSFRAMSEAWSNALREGFARITI